jgi:hypothetical protein
MRKVKGIVEILSDRLNNGAYLCYVDTRCISFEDYQRPEINAHVRRITNSWDIEFARPLLVSLRNGKLNVFDGRQTSASSLRVGQYIMLALVWDKWAYEREAKAFFVLNDSPKKMEGWKRFKADMDAGNQTNTKILQILHSHGLTTPFHPYVDNKKRADINKPSGVLNIVKAGGLELLKFYAKVMRNWKVNGTISESAKGADFVRAMRDFLLKTMNMQTEVLIALKSITPERIREMSREYPTVGRTGATQIRRAMESVTLLSVGFKKAA